MSCLLTGLRAKPKDVYSIFTSCDKHNITCDTRNAFEFPNPNKQYFKLLFDNVTLNLYQHYHHVSLRFSTFDILFDNIF